MSDKGQREWRFYIGDMMRFARNVRDYTDGLDQAAFTIDRRTYDVALRNPDKPDPADQACTAGG